MDHQRADARGLLASYLLAKIAIVKAGFEPELAWQEGRSSYAVDETIFLREASWVVLSSGMRESVVRRVFPAIESAFGRWTSSSWIVEHAGRCTAEAARAFRHTRKLEALVEIAGMISTVGVERILADLNTVGPDALLPLPFMGPATSRHLAKNLGFNVAKPDRHLVRVARATGYETPEALCAHLAEASGDTVAVVDLVIWRYATIARNYLDFFASSRERTPETTPGRGRGTSRSTSPQGACGDHGGN
jgi:hypothetical protein